MTGAENGWLVHVHVYVCLEPLIRVYLRRGVKLIPIRVIFIVCALQLVHKTPTFIHKYTAYPSLRIQLYLYTQALRLFTFGDRGMQSICGACILYTYTKRVRW